MITVPLWVWAVSLAGVVGMLGSLVAALPRHRRADAAVVLALWLAVTAVLAGHGTFVQDRNVGVPWIAPTILVALLLGLAGLRSAPGADLADLTRGQTFRVIGGVFLALLVLGQLPPVFALPAGLGDVAIGLAAPFVSRRLRRGDTRGAVLFHVLGVVDLVVAIGTGFLAAPGPYQVFTGPVSTSAMTALPLVLIPTVLVPVSIAVHLVAVRRLSRDGRPAASVRLGPVPVRGQ
jgi:hypothetical protein